MSEQLIKPPSSCRELGSLGLLDQTLEQWQEDRGWWDGDRDWKKGLDHAWKDRSRTSQTPGPDGLPEEHMQSSHLSHRA